MTPRSPGSVLPLRPLPGVAGWFDSASLPGSSGSSGLPGGGGQPGSYSVVIPTLGARALTRCLIALATARGPAPERVILVDRRPAGAPWTLLALPPAGMPLTVVDAPGASPAAARNAGWRIAGSEWVAFLDEAAEVTPGWRQELAGDLRPQPAGVAGVRGRVLAGVRGRVLAGAPGGPGRGGLRWIGSDVAYRRAALADAGGFAEDVAGRREHADLAQRLHGRGWALRTGRRATSLPRPSLPRPSLPRPGLRRPGPGHLGDGLS